MAILDWSWMPSRIKLMPVLHSMNLNTPAPCPTTQASPRSRLSLPITYTMPTWPNTGRANSSRSSYVSRSLLLCLGCIFHRTTHCLDTTGLHRPKCSNTLPPHTAKMTPDELETNEKCLEHPFNVDDGIESLWRSIADVQTLATDAGEPIPTSAII